jgi:hypothetical protein
MNALPMSRFIQVPLRHYAALVQGSEDLTTYVKTILHLTSTQGACTRTELRKIVKKANDDVGPLVEEVKRGKLTSFVFIK